MERFKVMSSLDLTAFDYGTLVAFASLVLAIIGLYLQHRKDRSDIEMSKQGIEVLSKLVESYQKGQQTQQQLQQEILQFEKWKSLAKAAGWLLDHLEEDDRE
jgi:hypothetical protein